MPKSGSNINNKQQDRVKNIDFKSEVRSFSCIFDKIFALRMTKNGFKISDGCNEKPMKYSHLFEPFMSVPMNNTRNNREINTKNATFEYLVIFSIRIFPIHKINITENNKNKKCFKIKES